MKLLALEILFMISFLISFSTCNRKVSNSSDDFTSMLLKYGKKDGIKRLYKDLEGEWRPFYNCDPNSIKDECTNLAYNPKFFVGIDSTFLIGRDSFVLAKPIQLYIIKKSDWLAKQFGKDKRKSNFLN